VRRLALAEESASYARPGSADTAAGALRTALRTARRGLIRATPRSARLRAVLWPASVMSGLGERTSVRLTGWARRVPVPGRRTRPV
jgi:hypothetical protein